MPDISNEALDAVQWNSDGLVPAIAQDVDSGDVLMVAWMNREALKQTISSQEAVYWSRSRNRIWRKGESSGHLQKVKSIKLDCDNDVILLEIEQIGGIACHTGRRSCFFQALDETGHWVITESVQKDPNEIYNQ